MRKIYEYSFTQNLAYKLSLYCHYRFVFWLFEKGSHYAVQAGLELTFVAQAGLELTLIFLPQPPKCWITGVCHHAQLIYLFILFILWPAQPALEAGLAQHVVPGIEPQSLWPPKLS